MLEPVGLTCEYQVEPIGVDAPVPRFGWKISGSGSEQIAYKIVMQDKNGEVNWDSGRCDDTISNGILYRGKVLTSFSLYRWTLTIWDGGNNSCSASSSFFTGKLGRDMWSAYWIGMDINMPFYLRRRFNLEKLPSHAVCFVSAVGQYNLAINGQRINKNRERYLGESPAEIGYRAFDIRAMLRKGENEIMAIVAKEGEFHIRPASFFCQIESGQGTALTTDLYWENATGMLEFYETEKGERWDFNAPMDWEPVREVSENLPTEYFVAESNTLPTNPETYTALRVDGERKLFRFEKNIFGKVSISLQGEKGENIWVFTYNSSEEALSSEEENFEKRGCCYVVSGGEEVCEPMFYTCDFSYVEIVCSQKVKILGVLAYEDISSCTMKFLSSNNLLNHIVESIKQAQSKYLNGYVNNPVTIPVLYNSSCYNWDLVNIFEGYIRGFFCKQKNNGEFDISNNEFLGSGEYSVLVPHEIYKFYGADRLLTEHYLGMKKFVSYLGLGREGLTRKTEKDYTWFDLGEKLDKNYVATVYYAHVVATMIDISEHLGELHDKEHYTKLLSKIKKSFMKEYVLEGKFSELSQISRLLALRFNMFPRKQSEIIVTEIAENIRKNGADIASLSLFLPTLSEYGKSGIACEILLNGISPDWVQKEYDTITMGALSNILQWIYMYFAGVNLEHSKGKLSVTIAPQVSGMDWVKASYGSVYGEITVDCSNDKLNGTIPDGTTANLVLGGGNTKLLKGGSYSYEKTK